MRRRYRWWQKNRCPHVHIDGIYGDAILETGRGYRLRCRACGRLLDGPVSISFEKEKRSREVLLTSGRTEGAANERGRIVGWLAKTAYDEGSESGALLAERIERGEHRG